MSERVPYSFVEEPRGPLYAALVDLAGAHCATALLVVRDGIRLAPSATEILDALSPHAFDPRRTSEWPGTRLFDHTATVHEVAVAPAVLDVLRRAVDGLYEWLQPAAPEDLCFLRADGSAWLTTIAHESEALLELSAEEARAIAESAPELWQLLRAD